MKRNTLFLLLCVALSVGASYFVANKVVEKHSEITSTREAQKAAPLQRSTSSGSNQTFVDFSDAAQMSVQAVVYVKVVKRAKNIRPNSVLDLLFGFASTPQDQVGMGSGVIIYPNGYIVTNNHVISGADEIEVTLENNTVYKAELVGSDPATDIALLKIDADDLPCVPLGDSDALRLGEWVLAIGSPYDLRSTITAGIVSAKGRSLPNYDGQYRVESFIQTDAAVNPGNSGGALVNAFGELVGINTSIISLTGSYAGYSFAVPVNIVKKIANDFIEFGHVQRAMLGVSMSEVTAEMARSLGLASVEGVYVVEVQKGGAADRAGIQVGDVISEINLNKLKNGAALQEQMSRLRPGEQVAITVIRNNEQKEFVVNL